MRRESLVNELVEIVESEPDRTARQRILRFVSWVRFCKRPMSEWLTSRSVLTWFRVMTKQGYSLSENQAATREVIERVLKPLAEKERARYSEIILIEDWLENAPPTLSKQPRDKAAAATKKSATIRGRKKIKESSALAELIQLVPSSSALAAVLEVSREVVGGLIRGTEAPSPELKARAELVLEKVKADPRKVLFSDLANTSVRAEVFAQRTVG